MTNVPRSIEELDLRPFQFVEGGSIEFGVMPEPFNVEWDWPRFPAKVLLFINYGRLNAAHVFTYALVMGTKYKINWTFIEGGTHEFGVVKRRYRPVAEWYWFRIYAMLFWVVVFSLGIAGVVTRYWL